MARKKRPPEKADRATPRAEAAPAARAERAERVAAPSASAPQFALPSEVQRGDWTVAIFAAMMVLAPAVGVPNEEMLQDTLKSIVVSFAALAAALLFFWQQRNRRDGLRWHLLMWLPLALMAYALGSMAWSHTYLAAVEAIRWFVFSVLLWLGINSLARDRVPALAWGIHMGAVVASLWAMLQFWTDLLVFPQGPNPASTFVNRNFFAEYVVCTIPFSVLLLARARHSSQVALLAFTLAANIVAILMTGTRSALAALALMTPFILWVLYLFRAQFAFWRWSAGTRILAIGLLLTTIVGLGVIPTGNPRLVEESRVEGRGLTAMQRAFARGKSMTETEEYTQRSFSIRLVMWKATTRIIAAHPLAGIGAGAWEVDIPLYQTEGSQLETDYYVHNEFLQLLAEYGLVGALFLVILTAYLLAAAWRTWRDRGDPTTAAEGPLRALTLVALMSFFVISTAGFPWRMASTGALFAMALAVLAASDARLGIRHRGAAARIGWRPAWSQLGAIGSMMALALAAHITQQAAASESKIVRATKMALTVSQSNDYNNPRWDKLKREMLQLVREGIAINPHYRKITPMVGDELAKWGDWRNATWIWESVIGSRPYVTAILSNIARGYAAQGQTEKAMEVLSRAQKIQPKAPAARSLQIVLLSRAGKEKEALVIAREAIDEKLYDFDTLNAAFLLGWRQGDPDFAEKVMAIRLKEFPGNRAAGYLQLGNFYLGVRKDEKRSLEAFRSGVELTPPAGRSAIVDQVPVPWRQQLGLVAGTATTATGTQTSASSK